MDLRDPFIEASAMQREGLDAITSRVDTECPEGSPVFRAFLIELEVFKQDNERRMRRLGAGA